MPADTPPPSTAPNGTASTTRSTPGSGRADACFGPGDHLVLIDGSGYIYRAYHALPPLTRESDGLPVGAVYGFTNMLHKLLAEQHGENAPTHLAVVFDARGPSFRNEIFPAYKANRPPPPEDLVRQFELIREATRAFSVPVIEKEGFEADDIIATLAREAAEKGGRVTIISSDKDLMQLVSGQVRMLDPIRNRPIGPEEVERKFGVPPEKVVDVQALAGDSTDNIPGAPGIGIKTAALLVNRFGDLDNLLAHAEEIPQPKRRKTLIEFADQIRLSRDLVRLDDHVPLDVSFCDLKVHPPDPDRLLAFLAEMEFRTLLRRIAREHGVEPPPIRARGRPAEATADAGRKSAPPEPEIHVPRSFDTDSYECIDSPAALAAWIEHIRERGWVAIDTETTGLDEMQAELVGISLCVEPGKAGYIPLAHREDDAGSGPAGGLFDEEPPLADGQLSRAAVLEALAPVLTDDAIIKIGQNIKYDLKIFRRLGEDIAPIDDTMLLSYALHGGLHSHGMDELSERYLGHRPISIKPLLGKGRKVRTFDKVPIAEAVCYAAEDADITLRLWKLFRPCLHHGRVTRIYESEERPLVPVIAEMELAGIRVDRAHLERLSDMFAGKMAALEAEIHALAGEAFNVGSPAQLGRILFEKMGFEGGRKSRKTGAWSTSADVLEELAARGVELARKVLEWRQLAKLKSTYADALRQHVNPETGRVHTSYNIAGTATGRLASTDPNLQNIPVRTEEGREIRRAFIAEEGHVLVSLDYSQIELRVFAHMAGIDALRRAFAEGLDIHAMTASEMFRVPLEEMTPEIRRRAKAINYGIIYGISAFGLARNLGISRQAAQTFIDRYFERFPGIRRYMEETVAFAKEHGHVLTLFGRKIHIPNIRAKGPHAGMAQRQAINAPIQGSAADIIRRAMVRIPAAIADLPAKMLLQVHDELLFEVREDAAEDLAARAKDVMEKAHLPALDLTVPIVVDVGMGRSWADAH